MGRSIGEVIATMVTYLRRRPIASLPVKNGEREQTECAALLIASHRNAV
jgi:hypothetical protein